MRSALALAALCWAGTAFGEPLDLAALITTKCGPPGYRQNSGCEVVIPHGTFEVGATRIGDCTTAGGRVGLTLRGESAGMPGWGVRVEMAGTGLRYTGPPGGRMLDFCGVSGLTVRDLALDAKGASIALRVSANNAASAQAHFVQLVNLNLRSSTVGIEVTGEAHNDQADFVEVSHTSIVDTDIGYLQDSQQTVAGRLQSVEVTARSRGYEIRGGSLNCDNCYVGNWARADGSFDPDFRGFNLTRSVVQDGRSFAHGVVSIEHSHMELSSGRFVVEDAGASAPILLIGNSYGIHAGTDVRVLDSRSKAPVTSVGDMVSALSQKPIARFCTVGGFRALSLWPYPTVRSITTVCP